MWSYYGSKKSIINYYPPPKEDLIIEPFAGTAPYALKYYDRDVILIDKYEVIIKIWKWLQLCSSSDIRILPHKLTPDDNLNNFEFECEEAKLLMGFIIAKGVERPRKKPTKRATISRPNTINFTLNKIESNLHKIKHWDIRSGSYEDLENSRATWFIDPPYKQGGYAYVENKINYLELGPWCKSRNGQVIVCENSSADWLPFLPMMQNKGTHKKTYEVIWSNHKTAFDNIQQKLF